MNVLFKNARILQSTKQPIVIGDLIVTDNKISYVGPTRDHQEKFNRIIDCKKNLLMPGFKNAHAHSGMSFLRSLADDMPLKDWLEQQVFPRESKLKPDDIYWLAQLSFLEYLTSGITAAGDMYFYPQALATAAQDFGFRELILITESGTSGTHAAELADLYQQNHSDNIVNYGFSLHAEYTASNKELEVISDLIHRFKAPFFTHLAETRQEIETCKKRHRNMTPTEFLNSYGLWDYGGGAYHCCYMSASDLELFKSKGLSVVTCPGSNVKLASGIAKLSKIQQLGINIAIGTDGPASNNALDMFREMFLMTGLQKLDTNDPSAMPAVNVLSAAISGGAQTLDIDADSLSPGKLADIIMIDLKRPNMQPIQNILSNLVFSGSKDNVKMTMINGKILYENGEFYTHISADHIYQKCQQIVERIIG